jgi:hypothetical protein
LELLQLQKLRQPIQPPGAHPQNNGG